MPVSYHNVNLLSYLHHTLWVLGRGTLRWVENQRLIVHRLLLAREEQDVPARRNRIEGSCDDTRTRGSETSRQW